MAGRGPLKRFGLLRVRLLLALIIGLAGLSRGAMAEEPPMRDPLEPFNRRVFEINDWLGGLFGGAATQQAIDPGRTDDTLLPPVMRQQIRALSANLQEPVAVAIDLVAGDLGWAANGAARFAINTTMGVLGTRDVASEMGYPRSPTDAGLALCRAGVMTEPVYLVMPLLGPTNTRDLPARFLTNMGIWRVLGLPLFYGYYGFTRLESALLRGPPRDGAPVAMPAGDDYAAQREAAMVARARRCTQPR